MPSYDLMGTLCFCFQSAAPGPLHKLFTCYQSEPHCLCMMWFHYIVGKTPSSEPHHLHLITAVSMWWWFIAEKWRLKPEIPLNLWHLRSTFLINSCLIPSHVSFLFLWSLWRNRDYSADKMCEIENGRASMRNWHIHIIMYFWHIDAHKPV